MTTGHVLVALVGLGLVSCGNGPEGDVAEAADERNAAESVCEGQVALICGSFAECCGYTVSECVERFMAHCVPPWESLYRNYGLRLDTEAYDACMTYSEQLFGECKFLVAPAAERQARVWCDAAYFAPAADIGHPCSQDMECVATEGHVGLCLSDGTCGEVPMRQEGQACGNTEGRCELGTYCDSTCRALKVAGDACESDTECESRTCGYYSKVCEHAPPELYCDLIENGYKDEFGEKDD